MKIFSKIKFLSVFNLFVLILFLSCSKDEVVPPVEEEIETGLKYIDLGCESCDHVVESTAWQFDGIQEGVQPGDTIGIPAGARSDLFFINIHGTKDEPVVIINCNGAVELGNSKDAGVGLLIKESSNFHVAGTGSVAAKYGIAARGYNAIEVSYLSTNYELYAVEVLEAGYAGIVGRSDATCDGIVSRESFSQYNTIIHDTYVHDTGGEGFYIGGSHWGTGQEYQPGCVGTLLWEPELFMVRIYNNIVKNTGRDGIQVSSAVEDCEIYNNYVEDYGMGLVEGHRAGIIVGGGTTGKLNNNVIVNGRGFGIMMFGRGDNYVFNNIIIKPELAAILGGERNPTPGLGWYFMNNTIIEPGGHGVEHWDQATEGSVYYNNIFTSPGGNYFDGHKNYVQSNNIMTDRADTLMFVDYNKNDYNLLEGSPAIDAGFDVASYGVSFDFEMQTRPVNGKYDVGAYEKQ